MQILLDCSIHATEYDSPMSKVEILDELAKLTTEERKEIRLKLTELDGDSWLDTNEPLTNAEKALLEARLDAYGKDRDAGSSWVRWKSAAALFSPNELETYCPPGS